MPVSDAFRDYVLEQLEGLGGVTWRRMFGGVGVYRNGAFFAVMDDDQVFFRVDDDSRPDYEARGSGPFVPMAGEQPMRGYYEVPADVLDDRDTAQAWARRALEAAAKQGQRRAVARERMSRPARGITGSARGVKPADILRPFPPRIRALANRLRALVKKAHPELTEHAYPGWRAVGYRHPEAGYVCGVFPADGSVRLLFEHGARLDDPDGLLEGKGKVRQVRYVTIRRPGDIRARAVTRLVRAAVALPIA